jgi:TRAP-type C4-dicarboxylate transport system substrate-binding protein
MKSLKWGVSLLLILVLLIATLMSACTTTPEDGEEVIELTYGSFFAPPHPTALADLAWIEYIETATEGRVHITPYWGSTLIHATESYIECKQGIADIAYMTGAYQSAGFELCKLLWPAAYGCPNEEVAQLVYNDLLEKFPELNAEFEGVKVMCEFTLPPYQVITARKAVRTLEDFQGLTLRTLGSQAPAIESLGGEGSTMAMSEVYISIQKGILDGTISTFDVLESSALAEVCNYVTVVNFVTSPNVQRVMNLDVYNSLPADIQQIFDDSIEYWSQQGHDAFYKNDLVGYKAGIDAGMEYIELSEEDLAGLHAAMEAAIRQQAADLDAEGLPATEIFEEMLRLIEVYS